MAAAVYVRVMKPIRACEDQNRKGSEFEYHREFKRCAGLRFKACSKPSGDKIERCLTQLNKFLFSKLFSVQVGVCTHTHTNRICVGILST